MENKENLVEIVEYWNKTIPIYEIMLSEEYDKKQKGESYEVIHRSEQAPWVVFGEYEWTAKKTRMSKEFAKEKHLI